MSYFYIHGTYIWAGAIALSVESATLSRLKKEAPLETTYPRGV